MIRNGYLQNDKCTEQIFIKGGDTPVPPVTTNELKIMVGAGGYVTCDGQKIEGTANVEAKANQSFEILIYPEKGYKLKQVMFGINDVTAMAKNNRYVTPKINDNTTLQITFEKAPITKHNVEIVAGEGGKVVYNGEEIIATSKTVEIESGSQITLNIIPNEGYEISKLALDGNDLTSDIVDGVYTTPVLTANAKIEVTFDVFAGISNVQNGNIKVYGENGVIVIEGAKGMVGVFSMAGTKVAAVEATAPATKVAVSANAYIVRVDGQSFKVIL